MRVSVASFAILLSCLATSINGVSLGTQISAETLFEKIAAVISFDSGAFETKRVRRAPADGNFIGSAISRISNTVSDVGEQISNAVGAPQVGNAMRAITDGVSEVAGTITRPFVGFFSNIRSRNGTRTSIADRRAQRKANGSTDQVRKTLFGDGPLQQDSSRIQNSASRIKDADDQVAAVSDLVGDVGLSIAGNGLIGNSIKAVTDTVGRVSSSIRRPRV